MYVYFILYKIIITDISVDILTNFFLSVGNYNNIIYYIIMIMNSLK